LWLRLDAHGSSPDRLNWLDGLADWLADHGTSEHARPDEVVRSIAANDLVTMFEGGRLRSPHDPRPVRMHGTHLP
jgi:hypothetical protein